MRRSYLNCVAGQPNNAIECAVEIQTTLRSVAKSLACTTGADCNAAKTHGYKKMTGKFMEYKFDGMKIGGQINRN
jgi:hypothetical protein